MRISHYICMLGFVMLASTAVAAPVSLKPRFTSSERFGETFTASFHGADDSVFLLQYIFSNAGFGDKKGGCRLLAIPKGQTPKNVAERVDSDGWQYNASNNTLQVSGCRLSTTGTKTQFYVNAKGLKAMLAVDAPLMKRNMPRIRPKEGFFEAEVMLAGAKSTLTYNSAGRQTVTKGRTYLDHSRSTAKMAELATAVYRVRAMGSQTTIFQVSSGPMGKRGWVYKTGMASLSALKPSEIQINASDKTPSISINAAGGINAKVKTKALLYRYRPVESYGMMGRLATSVIGNPETATFLVDVTLSDGTVKRAVMERTLANP